MFVSCISILLKIVQLGLGFKLNTKIGLHTTHPPTHHTNFLKGSRPSRRLRFGMLTLLTKIRSSAEEKKISPKIIFAEKKFFAKKIFAKKKFSKKFPRKKNSQKKIHQKK